MRLFKYRLGLFLLLWIVLGVAQSEGVAFDLIVSGSGGEDEYVERFDDWGKRLRAVLTEQCGHAQDNVTLLNESGEDADATASLKNIRQTMQKLSSRVTERDDVFIFLIGHGSYRRQVAKFNIPGPDLTAEDLGVLLQTISARRIVVVNGASMSSPFVNALSKKNRIICTGTRSIDQRNATRFMGFFVQALEDGSADQNRDERISVLEICRQASSLTEARFLGEGIIETENALLDDNGDARGTRLSDIESGDGDLAARCFLMDFKVPEGVAPSVVKAYSRAIDDVQALIGQKSKMNSAVYYQQLKDRLLKAARLNQKIRSKNKE